MGCETGRLTFHETASAVLAARHSMEQGIATGTGMSDAEPPSDLTPAFVTRRLPLRDRDPFPTRCSIRLTTVAALVRVV